MVAVRLADVVETMRPLAIEPLTGAPAFVLGVSIIRGAPVPVVDAGALVGAGPSPCRRLVALRVDRRAVALGVDDVVGVRAIAGPTLRDLPPLLGEARADGIASLGSLDRELLLVLHAARILPEAVWASVPAAGAAS